MKLKGSICAAVLLLSCAAFGQTVKLGFLDHDKKTQYCDYIQLTVEKTGVVTGTHYPTASGSTFADDTLDELGGYMGACGCSYYYVTKLRPSTPEEIKNNVYGWVVYDNFGGTASVLTYGFTTKELGNDDQNALSTYDENLAK